VIESRLGIHRVLALKEKINKPEKVRKVPDSVSDGYFCSGYIFFKEVTRGGERTRVLSILFIFSLFTTLPLSHSSSPTVGTSLVRKELPIINVKTVIV
jgi:hypothetical protein